MLNFDTNINNDCYYKIYTVSNGSTGFCSTHIPVIHL